MIKMIAPLDNLCFLELKATKNVKYIQLSFKVFLIRNVPTLFENIQNKMWSHHILIFKTEQFLLKSEFHIEKV